LRREIVQQQVDIVGVLGDQELDREVYLVQRPTSESLQGVAGYLGISSLEAKEVAFDFERNELKWRNKSGAPARSDKDAESGSNRMHNQKRIWPTKLYHPMFCDASGDYWFSPLSVWWPRR